MTRWYSLLLVAGAAALAGSPSAASAQQKQPRSTVRIPVGKDRAVRGERVQESPVARTDTVRLPGRVDTVTVTRNTTDTVTVTRVDTVIQPIRIRQAGGFYAGIAGGGSLPVPDFNDANLPGWRVEVPLGYDPVGSPVGIRVSAGYGQNTPHDYFAQVGNAQMMNADGDLKIRLVSATPAEQRVQVYGVGGVSYVRFRDIVEHGPGGWSVGNNAPVPSNPAADTTWHSGMGWNAGAGFEVGKGRTNFFVEARFVRFKGVVSNVSYTPILVGFTWY